MQNKGYIHLYTGNGKGKTTAAIGLAIRAIGGGKKVFLGQFVKGMPYSELLTLNKISNISYKQFGCDCFIINKPTSKDIDLAREGLDYVKQAIQTHVYDMVILDEACIAVHYNLFSSKELLETILLKPQDMEIVITGRYATPDIIDIADLVTEMKEIKHYYNNGIEARKGIEY